MIKQHDTEYVVLGIIDPDRFIFQAFHEPAQPLFTDFYIPFHLHL